MNPNAWSLSVKLANSRTTLTQWGDMQNILAYWSDEAVYLLCRDRSGEQCVKPKAGLLEDPLW